MKFIPNFFEVYCRNGYSARKAAKELGICHATAILNLKKIQRQIETPLAKQLQKANTLAIQKNTEAIANGDPKAIENQFKYSIAPILQSELKMSESKIGNAAPTLKSLVDALAGKLTPYQKEFDACETRFKGILSSTKAGKTFFCIYEILKNAEQRKFGEVVWWVAPTYKVAKIAMFRISNLLRDYSIPCEKNMSDLEIRFSQGQRIVFKSAENADNLYGEDVHFCVFDEFTRASETAWHAVYSTLTATRGKATLIGNFTSAVNWGVRMVQERAEKNPEEYSFFKVTAWQAVEAGILSKKVVENAQLDLHEVVFNALYLAEGSYDELALMQLNSIEKVFEVEDATKLHLQESFITADIALQGSDLFVVAVWRGLTVVEFFTMETSTGKEVQDAIFELAEKYQVKEANIAFDADGVGGFLHGYFPNAQNFNGNRPQKTYANLRTRCYFELAKSVNRGELKIADSLHREKIIQELCAVKKSAHDFEGKIALVKKSEIRKQIGHSPDFADALMMRMFFEIAPKNLNDYDEN